MYLPQDIWIYISTFLDLDSKRYLGFPPQKLRVADLNVQYRAHTIDRLSIISLPLKNAPLLQDHGEVWESGYYHIVFDTFYDARFLIHTEETGMIERVWIDRPREWWGFNITPIISD